MLLYTCFLLLHIQEKETALHSAARYGGIEDVRLLLLRGADPNAKNKVCMHTSVQIFHLSWIKYIYMLYCSCMCQDGGTAIHYVKDVEVCRFLIQRGAADPQAKDSKVSF